jgi:hypothetical protein
MRCLRFLFAVLLAAWLVALAGCSGCNASRQGGLRNPAAEGGAAGSSTMSTSEAGTSGAGGTGGIGGDIFPTGGTGGAGGGPTCAGVCKEWEPINFDRLRMLWLGPSEDALPCPDVAPFEGSELFADPIAPFTCPSCSCSPAGCTLPEHMHVSAATCPGDGAQSIAWDSPAWEGACTAEGAIAPGLMCGGEPCTQSLTIGAATVEPCHPVSEGAEYIPDPAWGMLARECLLGPPTGMGCAVGGEVCVPAPPAGFTLCVHRDGDDPRILCPKAYPYRYVMYAGVSDQRSCAPCGCGDPQGAACSALVEAFADGACGAEVGSAVVAPGDPQCVDLPAGTGLGSKAATWMEQTPGSCAPNGGPAGEVVLFAPETLCCETEPYKPPE